MATIVLVTVSVPPLLMPPPLGRAIAGEGAVGHRQRAAVGDAAAVAGAIAGEGAVGAPSACRSLQMPPPIVPALLPEKVLLVTVSVPCCRCRRRRSAGAVAGEGAVGHRQRAAVVDAAAAAPRYCRWRWSGSGP